MSSPNLSPRSSASRRRFLQTTSLTALAAGLPRFAEAQQGSPGFIIRQQEPNNFEMPFASLDSVVTPNDRFYIRNHFAMPRITAADWSLDVSGAVERPYRLSYAELVRMASRSTTCTMECAGNNRVALVPRERGVLWESGAVGTAEWTGVPLAAILERAGVRNGAVEVILEGADEGAVNDEPRSPGTIHYSRSLPIAKARQQDVLLAYLMNGQQLPQSHGFPLRAMVPGWYGCASVKWLTRVVVVDRPFQGFYQTMDYAIWDRSGGEPALQPIGEMEVKASIARPGPLETIAAGAPYRIHGAAWTGEASITGVEVSVDGGTTWAAARLLRDAVAHCWRLWEFTWMNPPAGRHTLMARATDSRNRVQPMQRVADRRNYMISHVLPVVVDVR